MDKQEIQVFLDKAIKKNMDEALNIIKALLFDHLKMKWECVDHLMVVYKSDRSTLTVESILMYHLISPKEKDESEWC